MADPSMTTALILNLIAGGCWTRRQLPNGIRYICVASDFRKSLTSVEGVLRIKLVIFYSMADYSTTAGRILDLFAGAVGLAASYAMVYDPSLRELYS